MNIPKVKAIRTWSIDSVRNVCINHELFTKGDNEVYGNILNYVAVTDPDYDNLWYVADRINFYSEDQTVNNIMFLLEKYAVITVFEIEDN